mmetsp:Transcript_14865/g.18636  ORF Transcript_14865/g.18636 Transcript_14865/m.18636 type:complete len:215 (+) Transcript_14865:88-732(+)
MGSLFAAMYSKTNNDESCELKKCHFESKESHSGTKITPYSVQEKFKMIFEFGTITYFSDAVFRFVVVLGLKYNKLWVQIFGIILTVIVSTFLQTTLMILMPIYRYNTAGLQVCEDENDKGERLEVPCNAFVYITILVSLVWIASCCTSFAFNKNDYSKEFGYSTRGVADDGEGEEELGSDVGSPRQDRHDMLPSLPRRDAAESVSRRSSALNRD